MVANLVVRESDGSSEDADGIWAILGPIFSQGETYCQPRDVSKKDGLEYWSGGSHRTFVALLEDEIVGTYFLTPNQKGGGEHVCNCGFASAAAHRGKGIARKLLDHSIESALEAGFLDMQFNFVISTNEIALQLWQRNGFEIVGRLPGAFRHPSKGLVDVFVMYKHLDSGADS